MPLHDLPAWAAPALTIASLAVLLSALTVALRALWNLRNKK